MRGWPILPAALRPKGTEVRLPVAPRSTSSACGPLLPFLPARFDDALARRGRRRPPGAHAVAVGAARRLRCGARFGVVSQNSLRSLRSLRSNNCDESVHEARCARRPRSSAPRRHRSRLCRAAPAALQRKCLHRAPPPQQRRVRTGRAAPLERREAQVSRPRAKRASWTDSSQLSERSERSERSEFCDGPRDRASQGSRRAATTAPVKRSDQSGRAFAALAAANSLCAHSKAATDRTPTPAPRERFVRREPRKVRWSH